MRALKLRKEMLMENKKTALVTGASRGIGEAIARRLAGAGYDLVLTCSASMDAPEKIADDIRGKYGVNCICRSCDAGSSADTAKLFEDVFGDGKRSLDLLVNNAGISYVGLLHEMSDEDWDRVMSTNLFGVFYNCRQAVPLMLRNGSGRIINISSVWGSAGASMEAAYSASKGGVNSLTKALAKELAPSNIAVNAIACGMIDTEMNSCFSGEEKAAVINEIPADRIGTPGEVADLVLKVAEAPLYMTAQVITIDGGWM